MLIQCFCNHKGERSFPQNPYFSNDELLGVEILCMVFDQYTASIAFDYRTIGSRSHDIVFIKNIELGKKFKNEFLSRDF